MEKQVQFRAERCQKYALHQKMIQIKAVRNWILHKKVPVYLSRECS